MDETNYSAVIFGALTMGAILGLIPGIIGYKKGKQGLAIGGFIACIIGSFLLGLFLSVPMCVIFTVIILISSKKSHPSQRVGSNVHTPTSGSGGGYCAQCGKPLAPGQAFCTSCGMRQPVTPGPNRCPSCGCEVPAGMVFCSKCGTRIH